ncbi:uncharacterized protein LOC124116421 isoform X9 [Haliotis rufescens]|uniref:uncharacterized protein LOC124116421 isoform X9 n=1 Tax=Haliotis rufescens TaxID=6454 RepID=UPI00201F2C59|nr:uncharacterized protein LOC124116421 isoform X9 [Haliotis rufescens]
MADDETGRSETSSRTMSKLQDSGEDSGDTGQKKSKRLERPWQFSPFPSKMTDRKMVSLREGVSFLREMPDKEVREPLHVINLKKNRKFLLRDLDVEPLVVALQKKGILSRSEHDRLHKERSRRLQQCKLFLDILERKDEKAYDTLKDILDDTQPHIRKQLDKTSADDGNFAVLSGREDLIESFPYKYMTEDKLQLHETIRHLMFENRALREQLFDMRETARKTKDEQLEQLKEKETLTKQRYDRLVKAEIRQSELEGECNALRKENQILKTQVATQSNHLVYMEETVRKTKECLLEQLEERKTLITQQRAGTEQVTDLFQPSGEIVLSFSESEQEAQIFETLTQNKANMLKLFSEYGMRLDDIEQSSIHFKFSIPVGDDKIPVFQEASMKTIIAGICQGALNTLPSGKTEDIHFDIEFTPLEHVHYHIEANAVQFGDHNEMKMESTEFPSARITSSESEPSEVQRQSKPLSGPASPSETLYTAKIKFAAPGSGAAEAIMAELSNLKQVSYLDIEFERKQLNKVKLQIQRKEKSWEDFFTSVKKFINFPHLKRVIETHTVDVHVEMPFDDIQLTNPVKTNALQVGISNKTTMESAVPPNATTATSESRSGLDVTEALPDSDLQNPVKAEHPELGRSNKMTLESTVPPNATTATSESRSGLDVTEALPDSDLQNPVKAEHPELGRSNKMTLESTVPPNATTATSESRSGLDVTEALPDSDLQKYFVRKDSVKAEHPELGRSNKMTLESTVPPNATTATSESRSGLDVTEALPYSDLQNRVKSNSSQRGNKSHKQIEPPAPTITPFSNSSQESRLCFALHKVHM